MKLIALQIKTTSNFQENLTYLKDLINLCEVESLILAPELALSGFSYDMMEEAAQFSQKAIEEIKELSKDKTIALTFITKKENKFFFFFFIFNNLQIIHFYLIVKFFLLCYEI